MWKNLKMQLTFVAGLGPWTTVPEAKIAVILLIRQHSGLINAYCFYLCSCCVWLADMTDCVIFLISLPPVCVYLCPFSYG